MQPEQFYGPTWPLIGALGCAVWYPPSLGLGGGRMQYGLHCGLWSDWRLWPATV